MIKSKAAKNRKNLTGQRFGRLTVIKVSQNGTKKRPLKWLCKCDCGNEVNVISLNLLTKNHTKSCGCLRKDK